MSKYGSPEFLDYISGITPTCKRCGVDATDNYCPNCGKPTSFRPRSLWGLWYGITFPVFTAFFYWYYYDFEPEVMMLLLSISMAAFVLTIAAILLCFSRLWLKTKFRWSGTMLTLSLLFYTIATATREIIVYDAINTVLSYFS